jgi:NADH:ubiquinone oxidoreductase subunit 5 (subunit L)/multisubunit Na+/H+ antiporter MnhA subunit
MIRFSYILHTRVFLINFILICSVFTSLYAGVNSLFEQDMKKLIALSTLSHLGFIGIAFSVGLLYLIFFHLLTHALFKSLLFMSIGDIIVNQRHLQDIRYLSSGFYITPVSSLAMRVSLLNLLGIPSLRGFFSKDMILECINYRGVSSVLVFLVYLNVFFTYSYTFKLFSFIFNSVTWCPLSLVHPVKLIHASLLRCLALTTLFFSSILSHLAYPFVDLVSLPVFLKYTPLTLNLFFLVFLLVFAAFPIFKSRL